MPTSLGPAEIMVILVVALIVLGPKRLPDAGRQVGKAIAEVRRWTTDMKREVKSAIAVEAPGGSTVIGSTATTDAATGVPSGAGTPAGEIVETSVTSLTGPSVTTGVAADTSLTPVASAPDGHATPADQQLQSPPGDPASP